MKGRTRTAAFSLVELMIAVAIVAVLASIAGPAFSTYVMRSKRSEAYSNLGVLYQLGAAYYSNAYTEQGLSADKAGGCIVADDFSNGPLLPPVPEKRTFDFSTVAGFKALGFQPAGPLYYSYIFVTVMGTGHEHLSCNTEHLWGTGDDVHSYMAAADLDGDGRVSLLLNQAFLNEEGEMYRLPNITIYPPGAVMGGFEYDWGE